MKKAIKNAGYTQVSFADKLGVEPNTVWRWIRGDISPSDKRKQKIAELLGVKISQLVGDDEASEEKPNARLIENVAMIPIISDKNVTACCGEGSYYASDVQWEIEDYFPLPQSETIGYSWQGHNLKLIKATGTSMEPYIKEGDLVLFAEFYEVHERDIAVIALDGKVFVKGIASMTKDYILLRAYNWQVSPDIKVELDGSHDIAILGKVIKIISTHAVPQLS